ncbi:hypothetical protein J6590_108127, partial [Homalodisca vitripennis]
LRSVRQALSVRQLQAQSELVTLTSLDQLVSPPPHRIIPLHVTSLPLILDHATNYNNGTRSGPEKPSRNPGLRSESAGAGNGQELTPPIWQAL